MTRTLPANYDVDALFKDITRAKSLYHEHWTLPLSDAYNEAFAKVQATMKKEQEARAKRAELFSNLLALAIMIPVGGWLTATMGTACAKKLAGDLAIKQMSKSNSLTVIGVGVHFLESDASRYMLGAAFDEVKKQVSTAAMAKAKAAFTSDPFASFNKKTLASGRFGKSETTFKNGLEKWNYAHANHLYGIEKAILESSASAENKTAMARAVGKHSPWLAKQPSVSMVGDHTKAAEILELALWMGVVLSMDYKKTSHYVTTGDPMVGGYLDWKKEDIKALPSSSKYPKAKRGAAYTGSGAVEIGYAAPGGTILDRIDALYKKHIGGKFLQGKHMFGSSWFEHSDGFNGDELRRAEAAIPKLIKKYPIPA